MQAVLAPDKRKRGMHALLPSFLKFTLRVTNDCTQQNRVPNPNVMDVPILWISSSLDSWTPRKGKSSFIHVWDVVTPHGQKPPLRFHPVDVRGA